MKRLFATLLLLVIMCMFDTKAFADPSEQYQSKQYQFFVQMKKAHCAEMAIQKCPAIKYGEYYKIFTKGNKDMNTFVRECTALDWYGVCERKCDYEKHCNYSENETLKEICLNECTGVLKPLYENTPEFADQKKEQEQREIEHRARKEEQKKNAETARIQQAENAASELRRMKELQEIELQQKIKDDEIARIQRAETAKARKEGLLKTEIVNAKKEINRVIEINKVTSLNECTCRCLNDNGAQKTINELVTLYTDNPHIYTSDLNFNRCLTMARVYGFSSKQVDEIFNKYRESDQPHFSFCESICSETMPKADKKPSIKSMISDTLK